jgi:uncharacterized protein DUF4123
MRPLTDALIQSLWAGAPRQGSVYAVLDCARDPRIYPRFSPRTAHHCLYEGQLAPALAEAAPYLVPLEPRSPFTERLLDDGWGRSWGIYLASTAPLADVRRHLRRFLMVKDPVGNPMYFRYYDPRVLRAYLPTCNKDELQVLFGPLSRYWCESEDADQLIEFTCAEGDLAQRPVPLAA